MSRRIQPLSLLLLALDMALVPLALTLAGLARSTIPLGTGGALPAWSTQLPWALYVVTSVIWALSLAYAGAYNPQLALRWFNEAWRVVWGAALATVIMAGVLYLTVRQLSRLQFIYSFILAVALLLAYRAGLRVYYRLVGRSRPGGRNRILILGAGELGRRVAKVLLDHSRWGFHPVGFLDDDAGKHGSVVLGLPVLGPIDELRTRAEAARVEEIWIALPAGALERLRRVLDAVETMPLRIKVVPDYFSFALVRTKSEVLDDLPVIGLRDPLIEGFPRLVKRVFDILVTSVLMVPAGPLMALIVLAIVADSGRPALIRQQRVGENGRLFEMLKFRSMIVNVEASQPASPEKASGDAIVHKQPDDPRVTRLGRILRRFSLDELPQLFNVLVGDMSLVGPRPELPWLVDSYEPWQRKRFAVPQGITGWWQINGRSDRPMHLNTEDDLYYVYNYSLLLDILILIRTPLVVLRGEGAF